MSRGKKRAKGHPRSPPAVETTAGGAGEAPRRFEEVLTEHLAGRSPTTLRTGDAPVEREPVVFVGAPSSPIPRDHNQEVILVSISPEQQEVIKSGFRQAIEDSF